MTGKRYYLTTLSDWKRGAGSFANSHWIALETELDSGQGTDAAKTPECDVPAATDSSRILVVIEADEGAHATLEDDPGFEPLPHPLSQRPISDVAQAALARHGVAGGASTFDAAEAAAEIHPLLRHRVF